MVTDLTDVLLRYPMHAFLIGLFAVFVNVAWCLHLLVQTVQTHVEWRRRQDDRQ